MPNGQAVFRRLSVKSAAGTRGDFLMPSNTFASM